MTHTDLIARLDYLSERANPGPYGVESYGSGTTYLKLGTWVGHYASDRVPMMGGGRAEVVNSNVPSAWGNTCRKGHTAHLLVELANAYRAGKLRAVDVDRRTSIEAADALTAAQERIEALEGAIRPFADIADLFDSDVEGHSDADELSLFYGDNAEWLADRFTLAQFNAARAALDATGKGEAE